MTEDEQADSFTGDEPKSSRVVLAALRKAEDAFREWQATCQTIDQIYNLDGVGYGGLRSDLDGYGWQDAELDLFWSSYEVLKPAVYARPPQPVVAPLFKDGKPHVNITAELLERCAVSAFKRTGIDDVMLLTRDDLIFTGRGAPWVRYETEGGKHKICIEHKDRLDFLHEPARKWPEVGWAAGAAWLTRKEMRKRFQPTSGNAYQDAKFTLRRDDDGDDLEKRASTRKCKVWEVWHKADNRVYWVSEGIDVLLDSGPPHLELTGFFPCPKPAYATLKRRSLIPLPDWQRYAVHFHKISELTRRIYSLLDAVKMKGLVAGGGDVGDAIEQIIRDESDQIIIPVPGAALLAQGSAPLVVWLPLVEIATAIQGLIEARTQLVNDFYQLSGISDIMRGATEAEETLGAQQLKTQYGSVRVRDKSTELQRVAADTVKIAAEILAEKFPLDQLLEMSQMDIPTKADLSKRVREIEHAAKEELNGLEQHARQMARQSQQPPMGQQPGQPPAPQQPQGQQQSPPPQIDPEQAQQALQQAQQQIIAKYAPMLAEVQQRVPVEDVMKLLRDDRARNFVFEIESSSTILTDELQEKQSRNEFMSEFTTASKGLMGMVSMGEQGAKLAGAMLKFVLAPYRVGRELDGAIDEFIDAAPEMAKAAAAANGAQAGSQELAQANAQMAAAEQMKAQAAMITAQARAEQAQADSQRKITELQQKGAIEADKHQRELQKINQQLTEAAGRETLMQAQIDNLTADTATKLASIGLDERAQNLEEYRTAADAQARQTDQAMTAESQTHDASLRERGAGLADRQQTFTEKSGERQQSLAEQQAKNEGES